MNISTLLPDKLKGTVMRLIVVHDISKESDGRITHLRTHMYIHGHVQFKENRKYR